MGIGTALAYVANKYSVPVSTADAAQDFESLENANPNEANSVNLVSVLVGAGVVTVFIGY